METITDYKRIAMMDSTGCDADEAQKYLEAEEGNLDEAIISYNGDHDIRKFPQIKKITWEKA